ncbi:repeat domain-containing protein [Treponema sp. JC4]|uniref:leucine-rich repeat domain-containing protein n=1 Tax=Treponema sp. JC4 TaxID=1124982 RepID=UPI00025B0A24|nr:leucine-rich repeat domain-containing protein [Treponema sp. JC4]EID85740.1 repeat domain-containing protein [Treponema sp. JC4]
MRKEFNLLISALALCILLPLAGCKQDSPEEDAKTIQVTLDCNGGVWLDDMKLPKIKVIEIPYGEPLREYTPKWPPYWQHYKYLGWFESRDDKDNDIRFNSNEPLYKSITLYARWTPFEFEHEVTFIMEGEDMGPPKTVEPRESVQTVLPKLSRTDCDVVWYEDKDFTMEYDTSQELGKDLTLYGLWADYHGTWDDFIFFLVERDEKWFNDTTVRGFIIKDDQATSTEKLASLSKDVNVFEIKYLSLEDVEDTDFDKAIQEIQTGNTIEQKLSILSKLKSKKVYFNLRNMPNLNEFSDNSFAGFTSPYKLYLPLSSSITRIGKEAFLDCNNLCEFKIPSGVTEIGEAAFKNCYSIENEISIPEGVKEIAAQTFRDCKSIPKVNLTGNVEKICQLAFMGCEGLKEVIVPEGVKTVENGSFACLGKLDKIELPESLEKIDEYTFWKCSCDKKKYNGSFQDWEKIYKCDWLRNRYLEIKNDTFVDSAKLDFQSHLIFDGWKRIPEPLIP